ncbi:MAG: PEP-CTERM sorting domain-containing protein [Akkermansiaceae bacterium]|nr:PEP-CTERM sorting domain-containing protein [Akkermansiaceae bacterium]MCP5549824.1 PEP-CTERM sorting domain-containing protein [Akkermansiaceae bacterium]
MKKRTHNQLLALALAFVSLLLPGVVHAQFLLDWDLYDTSDWADGTLNGTFTNVNGSGVDVNVAVTGDTSYFESYAPRIREVDANSPYGEKFLQFGNIDYTDSSSQSITVTLSFFETGTTNPVELSAFSFQFFDIDTTYNTNNSSLVNYNDRMTFSGSPTITEVITTGRSSPTHSILGNVVQAWDGTLPRDSHAIPALGLNDLEGAVNVSYLNGGSVFSFVYDNGPNTVTNSVGQNVGIYDLNFTPVPEPASLVFLASGSLALLCRRPRRRTA